MFRKWLEENDVRSFDYSKMILPKGSDREFWNSKCDKNAVLYAEKYLGCEWPQIRASQFMAYQKEGDRLAQEDPHFNRRENLVSLVTGEVMEYKGRFLKDITDGLFAICEESYWGVSAHSVGHPHKGVLLPDAENPYIDLFASETGATVALTYYLLYDELLKYCPDILSRIEYELKRRIITPYLTHNDFWWMGYYGGVNNWNPWILSNILSVFLLMNERDTKFYEGIYKMLYEFQNIYDAYPQDGGCDEGPTYWDRSGGAMFSFLDLLKTATEGKIDFFDDEKIKNIGNYIVKAYIKNGWVANYSDGSAVIAVSLYYLYMFGKAINSDSLTNLSGDIYRFLTKQGSSQKQTSDVFRFSPDEAKKQDFTIYKSQRLRDHLLTLVYIPEISKLPEPEFEDFYILPDLETAYARKDKWYYSVKGLHNAVSHNHNDVGSFMVFHNGSPVLIDPGCGDYTRDTFDISKRYGIFTMQSGWHNLPIVNGTEQHDGHKYAADRFNAKDKIVEVSYKNAYPEDACLNNLTRRIEFIDNGVMLTENISCNKDENTVTYVFVTRDKTEIIKDGVTLNDEYILQSNTDCNIEVEKKNIGNDRKLSSSWERENLTRILFSFTIGSKAEIIFNIKEKS